jgi:hypothetical protein
MLSRPHRTEIGSRLSSNCRGRGDEVIEWFLITEFEFADRVFGPTIGKGKYGVMANRSETGIGKFRLGHRASQHEQVIWNPTTYSIRASGQCAAQKNAGYMTAPDSLAESPKKALAERGPSIHDPLRSCRAASQREFNIFAN